MSEEQFMNFAKSFYELNIQDDQSCDIEHVKFVVKKMRQHFSGCDVEVMAKTHYL